MNAIQRYRAAKAENPEALHLLRMGDFYEAFDADATTIGRKLGLAICTRDKRSEKPLPMAGFPYHQLDAYVNKLVAEGFRVIILEPEKAER